MGFSRLLYENDKQLLSLLSESNENALRAIYQKYWDQLFMYAYNVLREKETCEDIVQEIFIQLWQTRTQLVIKTTLHAYLFAATRYQVFHAIKKSSGRPGLFINLEERFSPDTFLYAKDTAAQIHDVVENLPKKCKDIYKLSREHQLSHKEIAKVLEISTKTVENQLSIALKRLRTALNDLHSLF